MELTKFIQLNKCAETKDLLRHPKEFTLLAMIACRAKRTNQLGIAGLNIMEAMVGDHDSCGLSRQEYRTSLKKLKKWGFLTIKSTSKGTIVKLINSTIFNINPEQINHQTNQTATIKQPSSNHQATTNNNVKNVKNEKKKKYSVLFNEFWKFYPRKTNKFHTWKTWQKLNSNLPDIEVLKNAIRKQENSEAWKKGCIPHASTWLNGRRWEDEAFNPDKYDSFKEEQEDAFREFERRIKKTGKLVS